jgi:hypothetical protein
LKILVSLVRFRLEPPSSSLRRESGKGCQKMQHHRQASLAPPSPTGKKATHAGLLKPLLECATEALTSIPGIRPIGTAANKASVLSFVIPSIPNADIAKHLDKHVSQCGPVLTVPQPAQRRFGVEGGVRPALAFYNTRDEVDTWWK